MQMWLASIKGCEEFHNSRMETWTTYLHLKYLINSNWVNIHVE